MNGIVATAETLIIADVPFLGWPIIKQTWEFFLAWLVGYFSKAAQSVATGIVIDTQVASEESNLSAALQALIAAEKSGDVKAIQAAIAAYAAAQSSLVNANGSALPQ